VPLTLAPPTVEPGFHSDVSRASAEVARVGAVVNGGPSFFEKPTCPLVSVMWSRPPAPKILRSQNKELAGMPVGQIVGSMNKVRPVSEVMYSMVEEYAPAVERVTEITEA
jgi:hypothetical protein